jgi:thioredoxin reductase (NADPH)
MIDLAVIGGGPAGISACIQAKRLGLDAVIIERYKMGGSVASARKVENFPPFSPVSGKKLAAMFERRHFESGSVTIFDEVVKIARSSGKINDFSLFLKKNEPVQAKCVIVASGQKWLVPYELKAYESFLSFPGELTFKEESVIVYGGGDVAVDQALSIRENGSVAELFCRSELKAKQTLIYEAREKELKVNENTTLLSLEKSDGKLKADFKNESGGTFARRIDKVLLATGKIPDPPAIENRDFKEILKAGFSEFGESFIKGLFVAGDLRRGRNRNIAVATGDGLMCAEGAFRYLKGA